MAKQSQVTIPVSLIPELEAWGRLTTRLFSRLREQAGMTQKGVPKGQAWYWTKQWQRWEREADDEIAAGKMKGFDTVEKLIADLNS